MVAAAVGGYIFLRLLPDNQDTPFEYAWSCPLGSPWCVTRILFTYAVAITILVILIGLVQRKGLLNIVASARRNWIVSIMVVGLIIAATGFWYWNRVRESREVTARYEAYLSTLPERY